MSNSPENSSAEAQALRNRIIAAVYAAIRELNFQLPPNKRVETTLDTVLFGGPGSLDSLALANFIVIAEQKLEDSLGGTIDLTQDDPFSPDTGHFRSVNSLASYVFNHLHPTGR